MNAHLNYSFDGFRLDPAKRELWRDEERVPLQPKAFECLVYLIQNRDRAVGKDELISAVWGDVDASDRVLGLAISRARQAIGDTGDEHHIIRTITRVGYSWVMPVDEVEIAPPGNGHANGHPAELETAQTPADTPQSDPPATGDHERLAARRWRGLALAAGVLVLLAAIVVAIMIVQRDTAAVTPVEGEVAVVLPVTVIGDDGASWIRLGVMDLIADRLREAGQAVVPSDNTVYLARSLNGTDQPTPEQLRGISEATNAVLIMTAEAERIGGHWRITLHTVHGRDRPLLAQGDDPDVLAAARTATDRMAYLLGYPPNENGEILGDHGLDDLLHRMRAADLSARYDEVIGLFDAALPEHRDNHRIRYQVAGAKLRLNRIPEARADFEALLAELPSEDDPILRALVMHGIGYSWLLQGENFDTAECRFGEAVQLVENLDSHEARKALGLALVGRGAVRSLQRNHEAALADYTRARFALASTADHLALANLNTNASGVHRFALRYDEALSHAERAAESAQRFQAPSAEVRARYSLVEMHLEQLDPAAALAQEPRLRELLQALPNPRLQVNVNLTLCLALIAGGRLQDGEALLQEVFELASRGGVPDETIPLANGVAAMLAWTEGQHMLAAEHAATTLQDWPANVTLADHFLARVRFVHLLAQLTQGQQEAAAETAMATVPWAKSRSGPQVDPYRHLVEAEYAAALGEDEAARAAYEAAHQAAEASRAPFILLDVARSHSQWLLRQGDAAGAMIVAGRVSNWSDRHYDAAVLQLRIHHALGDTAPWRSTLTTARALAGEREIPSELLVPPTRQRPQVAETAP